MIDTGCDELKLSWNWIIDLGIWTRDVPTAPRSRGAPDVQSGSAAAELECVFTTQVNLTMPAGDERHVVGVWWRQGSRAVCQNAEPPVDPYLSCLTLP